MKKVTALAHFANDTHETAAAAGVTRQAVEKWGDIVPLASAMELERSTKGELKVDHELYRRKKKQRAA